MSKIRKVLIVEENSAPPGDVRVWSEATTLRDAGWQVAVVCPKKIDANTSKKSAGLSGKPEDLDGVAIYRFPLTFAEHGVLSYLVEYLSAFVSITRLSWRVWRHGHFNIIHFCNPPDIFFPIGLFYRLLGAGVVFDQHDLVPELIKSRYQGFIGKLLYIMARVSEYLTFHTANVVISTNQSYRRIAMDRGGLPDDRVIIVRNGPETKEFVPVEPAPALKQDFTYMACYAGVMGYPDGVLELLQSIRHIVYDLARRDTHFVLLGDGAVRPKALEILKAWDLEKFVKMPGSIRDKFILRQYMCTADVLISPEPLNPLNAHSTFVKIGEYMAMGKPIVAYDLKETKFTAQQAAVYVEPGNIEAFGHTIVKLLDDPEKRQRMGTIGRQRVINLFGWEHQKDDLLRAYEIALKVARN